MDCLETIKRRKSIRGFTKEIPSRQLMLECLEAAKMGTEPDQPAALAVYCSYGELPGESFKNHQGNISLSNRQNIAAAYRKHRSFSKS